MSFTVVHVADHADCAVRTASPLSTVLTLKSFPSNSTIMALSLHMHTLWLQQASLLDKNMHSERRLRLHIIISLGCPLRRMPCM